MARAIFFFGSNLFIDTNKCFADAALSNLTCCFDFMISSKRFEFIDGYKTPGTTLNDLNVSLNTLSEIKKKKKNIYTNVMIQQLE
jgi:hypothetical protein